MSAHSMASHSVRFSMYRHSQYQKDCWSRSSPFGPCAAEIQRHMESVEPSVCEPCLLCGNCTCTFGRDVTLPVVRDNLVSTVGHPVGRCSSAQETIRETCYQESSAISSTEEHVQCAKNWCTQPTRRAGSYSAVMPHIHVEG